MMFGSVRIPSLIGFFPVLVACLSASLSASGQTVDPRGVFFHEFGSATFSGREWVTILEQPGDRRYEFSDVRALAPFSGQITEDGTTTWDVGLSGSGSFSGSDRGSFDLIFGGTAFGSEIWRAPGTTADFITQIDTAVTGDLALAGQFRVTVDDLDARTGEVLGTRLEIMTLDIVGETIRLTEGDGDFVQGVFETDQAAGFRVVEPSARLPRYRTFDGSATNRGLNLLGDLRFDGIDAFSATMLLQTRTASGSQEQFVERYTAVRVPAPASGSVLLVATLASRRRQRS